MLLYICEKFHYDISHSFQLTEWTRIHGRNGYVQCSKGNNCKSGKPELQFMCSAHHLIVLYICVFLEISWTISEICRTQMMETLTDRRTNTQNFRGYYIISSPLFVAWHEKHLNLNGYFLPKHVLWVLTGTDMFWCKTIPTIIIFF